MVLTHFKLIRNKIFEYLVLLNISLIEWYIYKSLIIIICMISFFSFDIVYIQLVKSEDKLLLVEMCTNNRKEYLSPKLLTEMGWFEVSELNKERNDWIQVEDLGGRVLFVDYHCSFSCLPNQIPGFRPNSIIFKGIFGSHINEHESYEVFEFGEQGFRSFEDIPEYIRLFPSPPWIFSNG